MAQRLKSEFNDDYGRTWTIIIHDTEYAGALNLFTVGGDGFKLQYHGSEDTHQPLVASTVSFTMLEQSTADDSFLDDLVHSYDGQITITIGRTGITDIYWHGTVSPEQIVRADIGNPAPVQITAACGLGRLEDIKFRQDNGQAYTGQSEMPVILARALARVPSSRHYGTSTSDAYIVTMEDFRSQDHNNTLTNNWFVGTIVDNSTFYNELEDGEDRFYSCADILRSMAITWNARIFQANGRWFFVPVGTYRTGTTAIPIKSYRKTGAVSADYKFGSVTNVTKSTGQNLKRLRGWNQTYLKPLKQVFRTQDFQGNVPLVYDYTIPSSEFPANLADADRSYTAGTQFRMQGTIRYEHPAGSDPAGSDQLKRFRIKITFQCGTQYLKRSLTFSGTATDFHSLLGTGAEYTPHQLGPREWSTNSAESYELITSTFDGNEADTIEVPFDFVTPPLPSDEDHIDIQINGFLVNDTGASTSVNSACTGYIVRVDLNNGNGSGDIAKWTATADTASTEIFDQGVTLLGGVLTYASRGVLEVNTVGGVYAGSDSWDSNINTGGLPINQLGVIEVLRYRTTARSVQNGTLRGSTDVFFYSHISTLGIYHIVQELAFVAQTGETELSMYANVYDTTSTVTGAVDEVKDTRPPAVIGQTSGNTDQADQTRAVTTGINTGLADVQADVQTNTTAIAANSSDIATLQSSVANQAASIASNDTDIDNIQKIIKGDSGTDLGILSDTADNTAAALLVQSTSAKIQGGNNTNVTATQTSPGTIELNVQAGAVGSEAQVTALRAQGSSTVNTKATVSILGGDFRVQSPTQFSSGATVSFQDTATFNGSTLGISHDDLSDKPPYYHGILLDGAGGGDLVGTGSITFVAGDTLAHTGSGQEGIWQCISGTTINRAASESSATANWVAAITSFEKIGSPGDLKLADLDPSSGSDTFSDSLASFSLTTSAGLTLTGGAGIILIGTTTNIGTVTSTGTVTGANLTTAGTLTASGLTYPTSDGTNGQALTTDGSGNLTFSTISGGGGGGSTAKTQITWGFFDTNIRDVFIPILNETETTTRQRYNVYVAPSAGEVTKISIFVTLNLSGGTGASFAVQKMTGATSFVTLATASITSINAYQPQVLTFTGATFNAGDRLYFWVVNGFGTAWGNIMGTIEIEI